MSNKPAKHSSQYVIDLLDSHRYAARGVRNSKWAILAGSTVMAGGVLSTTVPAVNDVMPEQLPLGGAALVALAEVNRRGNRWMMNLRSKELAGIGIAPPKEVGGAFTDRCSGAQFLPPTKKGGEWTVITTDGKTQTDSRSH